MLESHSNYNIHCKLIYNDCPNCREGVRPNALMTFKFVQYSWY